LEIFSKSFQNVIAFGRIEIRMNTSDGARRNNNTRKRNMTNQNAQRSDLIAATRKAMAAEDCDTQLCARQIDGECCQNDAEPFSCYCAECERAIG
jgi:hypothetical protein